MITLMKYYRYYGLSTEELKEFGRYKIRAMYNNIGDFLGALEDMDYDIDEDGDVDNELLELYCRLEYIIYN